MMRNQAPVFLLAGVVALTLAFVSEAGPKAAPTVHPFVTIHRVLTSPRCMNCHPKGDVPLQGDDSRPHTMQIRRGLGRVGMSCQTCHRPRTVQGPGLPPGAANWRMPPKETPMVFEGMGVQALCEQLRDPKRNGYRSLDDLVHHVGEDHLVAWGWHPGPGRTPVPVPLEVTVAAMSAWRDQGGSCPEDKKPWTGGLKTPTEVPGENGHLDAGSLDAGGSVTELGP